MPVIVARRRCEIVERRVSLSNALVASQNTTIGALPRLSPFRPIGGAPVSQRNTLRVRAVEGA
jgi:hypothetical protein